VTFEVDTDSFLILTPLVSQNFANKLKKFPASNSSIKFKRNHTLMRKVYHIEDTDVVMIRK
jgi:hypothetical protein